MSARIVQLKPVLIGLYLLSTLSACVGDTLTTPSTDDEPDAGHRDVFDAVSDPPVETNLQDAIDVRDVIDAQDAVDGDDVAVDLPLDTAEEPDQAPDAADAEEVFPAYPEPTVEGWIYDVDDSFWANMDDFVFNVLQGRGVSLYLAVFSANFFKNEAYRALGMELVRQPESFFENALIPLLERYGDSGVIWAIDCMNEPEALVAGSQGNWAEWGVSWDEMASFLSYCAEKVHVYSWLPASSGSGWHDWENIELGYYTGLGFDFLDFHVYADSHDIPTVAELGVDLPVIIGECGQSSVEWDDALQLEAVRQCFSQAESGGYSAALSWYYDYPGSTNRHAHLNGDGSWRPVEAAFAEFADSSLWVGTNLAWFSGGYGHDMAVSTIHPTWSVVYDHDIAVSVVEDLRAHDIDLLRFWVFEGGEALYMHSFFEDFETGLARWEPFANGVSLRTSALHVADGDTSLAIHMSPSAAGWHGISAQWDLETPLNIETAAEWRFDVTNDLDKAVGVNLAFITQAESGPLTYQTRSGLDGGQIWLEPEQSRTHAVSLSEDDFPSQWALATSPDDPVDRPNKAELQNVTEIRLRVYVSASQLPLSGDLYIDAVRIR